MRSGKLNGKRREPGIQCISFVQTSDYRRTVTIDFRVDDSFKKFKVMIT